MANFMWSGNPGRSIKRTSLFNTVEDGGLKVKEVHESFKMYVGTSNLVMK